ncbi:polynucleotide 3'-phosphatase [Penicillium taxi]|uniref:polynucleotide 3'-phosphatase n=1 Tax=Penicillium taxi TaxID=168475 RepID=UPI002545264C|nr:polynucleotide 3'-phosphatase [Penicillium taxi]KAJ5885263.1 polynucleotide 3'-phosphatase [Penicillium taxi]
MALKTSKLRIFITICLIQLAFAARSGFQFMEHVDAPPGWSRGEAPAPSSLIKFRLALIQPNITAFEQSVIDISTPENPRYGQFMTREELTEILNPDPSGLDRVLSWLKSNNVSEDLIQVKSNWITFNVTIAQAQHMLNTQFNIYHNDESNTTIVRALHYSVPREVYSHIQLIQPTTWFGYSKPQLLEKPVVTTQDDLVTDCGSFITPDCLRVIYGLYDTQAKPDVKNRLGIAGFLDQYARHSDFYDFIKEYATNSTDANFSIVSINGGLNREESFTASTEASLDIQYAISLAYHALATYYTTGGRGPLVPGGNQPIQVISTNEPYLEQLHYLISLPDDELPAVLTASYGEDEQTVPPSYATSVCNLFAQLGARGVSVIFSSGDAGPGGSCRSNDGKNRTKFNPGFPASCPFVTAVGGTTGVSPEKAVGFSGGGFSDHFSRPEYQNRAVQGYFHLLGNRWEGLYNRGGRGIPDVAAQASHFVIRDHGQYLRIGGTSASAPVFAAIVSRLNAARLDQGRPRMGFLNPWLYNSSGHLGFTDIVEGGSSGCGSSIHASWNATTGWDPVTGFGVPFFGSLLRLAMATNN